ncbi:hypothetical protein WR25_21850 [Diploscapter pachys]|uniref:Integrase zinc-binding domain-containing protein n=1 Tax=Diploscapter pachys TaxID=2018661 RepID=A0A2A2LQN1_9BILA|nr:hypothetical protein WR25_21850 [Diploscapter pachys]
MNYQVDEEERGGPDGDPFGGMPVHLYHDIVEFKRSGIYPAYVSTKHDRSAPSHWRHRCSRYTLADDNETLLYFNPHSTVYDHPKVVVKKGEVRKVLERIHELIGHLGQKRTQIVVLKKLFWRSVRQDVKNYIEMCDFCQQKKVEGKRIMKAPIDVMKDDFNINVVIRHKDATDGDRLEFHLHGYNENAVRQAAFNKMTSYTFKETQRRVSKRQAAKRKLQNTFEDKNMLDGSNFGLESGERFEESGVDSLFEMKREREDPRLVSLSEAMPSTSNAEEEHRNDNSKKNAQTLEIDDITVVRRPEYMMQKIVPKREKLVRRNTNHHVSSSSEHNQNGTTHHDKLQEERSTLTDIAYKYAHAVAEILTDRNSEQNPSELLSSYDAIHSQSEMMGLAPIMMLPSCDKEVIALQKELLTRQLALQRLQEKVLRAQYAHYGQLMNNGEPMHGSVMAEEIVEVEDLNVMDDGEQPSEGIDDKYDADPNELYGKRQRIYVENGASSQNLQEPNQDIE